MHAAFAPRAGSTRIHGCARGWALWKALLQLQQRGLAAVNALRVITDLLTEARELGGASG